MREELDKHLQQLNVLSFDDLISRLAEALQSEKGALLTAELQQRFEVALIDEFQDTDDSQWFIFSSLFAAPSQYLYLIGDPKQAIYKFRGADIYSYLERAKTGRASIYLRQKLAFASEVGRGGERVVSKRSGIFAGWPGVYQR